MQMDPILSTLSPEMICGGREEPGMAGVGLQGKSFPSWLKRCLLIFILAAAGVAFLFFIPKEYLTFETLKEKKELLKEFVDGHYFLSVVAYLAAHILTAFFVPGEILLVVMGGFLFGLIRGTLYVNIGMTIGAALAFLCARYLVGDWVQKKYSERFPFLTGQLARYGYSYLLFLRIVPLIPFCVVNYLAGIAKIPVKSFIVTTSLGVLPGSLFLTYAGQHLSTVNRIGDLLSPSFYLALSGLSILALLPVWLSRRRKPAPGRRS